MIQDIEVLIKEYSRINHRGQSRHAQLETGYIAAFTELYYIDQKSIAHSSGSIYKQQIVFAYYIYNGKNLVFMH